MGLVARCSRMRRGRASLFYTLTRSCDRESAASRGRTMSANTAAANEPITVGGLTIRYLIDGTATGGMGVFELTVPPGSRVPPPHSHTHNEECVYVLAGVLRYGVDEA